MSVTFIKVKVMSLSDETRVIKNEEKKLLKKRLKRDRLPYEQVTFNGLIHHRKTIVKPETRAAFLAYAFCRGKPYSIVERPPKGENKIVRPPYSVLLRAAKISSKYGPTSRVENLRKCKTEQEMVKEFEKWIGV